MIGIRYVVTDADSIPGGTMVYQQMAGDTPLRLFRIDGTNLGQYSPTRAIHITTAAEGLAALKSARSIRSRMCSSSRMCPRISYPGRCNR